MKKKNLTQRRRGTKNAEEEIRNERKRDRNHCS
jgi:hypothetical protein